MDVPGVDVCVVGSFQPIHAHIEEVLMVILKQHEGLVRVNAQAGAQALHEILDGRLAAVNYRVVLYVELLDLLLVRIWDGFRFLLWQFDDHARVLRHLAPRILEFEPLAWRLRDLVEGRQDWSVALDGGQPLILQILR